MVLREKKTRTEDAVKSDSTRIQIDLPEQSFLRLQRLKDNAEVRTYTDVVKNALRLYEYFVNQSRNGVSFMKEENGSIEKIVLFE